MHLDYLQIGANEGDTQSDHIFNKITKTTRAILIEPVPYFYNKLQQNYKSKLNGNVDNLIFLNIAISDKDDFITLYVPSPDNDFSKFPEWISGIASSNPTHIEKHLNAHNIDSSSFKIDKLNIKSYSFNSLIDQYKIDSVDNLHVDTEGHDYDILINLDLNKLKPKNIIFENKHMDGVSTKGDKYNKLLNYFKENGYKVISENSEDTHVALNIKDGFMNNNTNIIYKVMYSILLLCCIYIVLIILITIFPKLKKSVYIFKILFNNKLIKFN